MDFCLFSFYDHPVICAIVNALKEITMKIINSGKKNLIHLCHSTPASASAAIKYPLVGYKICANPSPSWNARTAVWRVTLTISASGAIIGIVTNAWLILKG